MVVTPRGGTLLTEYFGTSERLFRRRKLCGASHGEHDLGPIRSGRRHGEAEEEELQVADKRQTEGFFLTHAEPYEQKLSGGVFMGKSFDHFSCSSSFIGLYDPAKVTKLWERKNWGSSRYVKWCNERSFLDSID